MKTIKIDECIRRIRSYAMQFEAEGKKNISEDLWVALDYLKSLQKQPKTDWIPCEVETPKTNGVYQVIREIKECEVTYHIPTASYFDGQNTWHNDICVNFSRQNEQNVIAWQPIQPYKKEGAE